MAFSVFAVATVFLHSPCSSVINWLQGIERGKTNKHCFFLYMTAVLCPSWNNIWQSVPSEHMQIYWHLHAVYLFFSSFRFFFIASETEEPSVTKNSWACVAVYATHRYVCTPTFSSSLRILSPLVCCFRKFSNANINLSVYTTHLQGVSLW